ncbi:hypothetical protein WG78_07245 [Amantichitinum ursilacus]|uniref:Uncharacterized protein n=1 Tax=Amantichitinum ursilacus TaxID=857265 RepID=A0A0N0XJR1_9NEIS|nr:hypothetical protein WG78_07245 [Amantichitinum ursilacus]
MRKKTTALTAHHLSALHRSAAFYAAPTTEGTL